MSTTMKTRTISLGQFGRIIDGLTQEMWHDGRWRETRVLCTPKDGPIALEIGWYEPGELPGTGHVRRIRMKVPDRLRELPVDDRKAKRHAKKVHRWIVDWVTRNRPGVHV